MKDNGNVDLIRLFSVGKSNALDPNAVGTDISAIIANLAPYDPDIIIADIGDSGNNITELMKFYGRHKVFGCKYPSTPKSSGNLIPVWNENGNIVSVDKLMQNKRYISKMKNDEIGFYRKVDEELALYMEHWSNVVIRDEEDLNTGNYYQIITRKGDDHFSQASVYSMIGYEKLMDVFYGNNSYEFNSEWLNNTLSPTMPDIFD